MVKRLRKRKLKRKKLGREKIREREREWSEYEGWRKDKKGNIHGETKQYNNV
jgi:hypothetical protein